MTPPDRTPDRPAMIGLTGAIAAGKTAALDALARLGAATISSDAVVHELLGGEQVRDRLVERWGEEVAPGGVVDRGRVGALVFGHPEEIAWLESVLHPLVGERLAAWAASLAGDTEVAVVEVPLLFETGMEAGFDATLVIDAPDELRGDRAAARGTALVAERDARQLPAAEKRRRATFVVVNDGTEADLERALGALLPELAAARR